MEGPIRGLPLLSGPPPRIEEPGRHGCRKCGKEFGLFTRSRMCNHCGFAYCTSCSDHQALMARGNSEPGYDVVQVCAFCIDKLTITASGRRQLREMPITQLRDYLKAYGLRSTGYLEKDDIVDSVIESRGPNGCLSPDKEEYYRRHSVPNKSPDRARTRSLFSRVTGLDTSSLPSSPRASPAPQAPPPRVNPQTRPPAPRAPPRPTQPYPSNANTGAPRYRPPPGPPPPQAPRSTPPRPRAQQPSPPRPPPTPIPTLESLLDLNPEDLSALSVHSLKGVLYDNHVILGQILEKDDLVAKVRVLLEAERRHREHEAAAHAEEEQAYLERQAAMMEEHRSRQERLEHDRRDASPINIPSVVVQAAEQEDTSHPVHTHDGDMPTNHNHHSHPPSRSASPASLPPMSVSPSQKPPAPSVPAERSGLCVICQDEEANIVIVDCGHLAMCKPCSDLVLASSRECPLCRTRIVTPQRLLRVFKS